MNSKKNYIFHVFILSLLFSIAATLRFSDNHEKLPADCDEFGYLNLAKAFSNNNTFSDHSPRPYLKNLVTELKKNNIPELEYRWMIMPYAYHFSEKTNYKIINQYPPGTSFLISWIPIEYRKKSFPFLVIFFSFLIPFLFFKNAYPSTNKNNILIPLSFIIILFSISTPFLSELARINSLAFTFCLFITAGLIAFKKPHISLLLIFLSANFRLVNLLMLIPFIAIIFPEVIKKIKKREFKELRNFLLKCFSYSIIGITPYFIYAYLLLGNPFVPTYPSHDIASHGLFEVMDNVKFYLNLNQPWFVVHLVSLLVLAIQLRYRLLSIFQFIIILLFPLLNYSFFIFHKIQMDYYPFASGMILIGICIYTFRNAKLFSYSKHLYLLPFALAITMCVDGINRYINKEHLNYNDANDYYSELCDFDIVWGESLCGTAEYLCNNNGFKFKYATRRARVTAMNFLKENNLSQVILVNDISLPFKEIEETLTNNNIMFELKKSENLGLLLILK